jgi:predicted enzyme related to lactoylglutathione lyase
MTTPQLNGMLLASTRAERLHAWYRDALEPDTDEKMDQYRVLGFGGFWLMIDQRDELSESNPEGARVILNFEVDDAAAVTARMDELDTTWVSPLEDRDGSLFATAEDPDGNYVQVIQLSEEARAAMS